MSSGSSTLLSFAVLAIGDEVLRGEVVNGNAAFLSDRAFGLGLVPGEHAVVADDPAAMVAALHRLCDAHRIVFVTGGLGPTDDDRTVDVVSQMLGVSPVVHGPSRQNMRDLFAQHNFTLTPNNERQVRVPEGVEVLSNAVGLAPGFCVNIGNATAFFMPGVPREMNRIFDDHVAPRVQAAVVAVGGMPTLVRTWHVYGLGESHIDHRLAGLMDGVPDASLHYRAAPTECHVRVVLRHAPSPAAEAEANTVLAKLDAQVFERLGPAVYGVADDTFPLVVQRAFASAGKTLAFAESCTGGYAGQLLTEEPGASRVFLGSIVSYGNAVKVALLGVSQDLLDTEGAVSEACAAGMADGARRALGSDVAVSITGIAGDSKDAAARPAPPADGEKPVGTVCFGVSTAAGTRTEKRVIFGGRERIRRAAAFAALDLARRALVDA